MWITFACGDCPIGRFPQQGYQRGYHGKPVSGARYSLRYSRFGRLPRAKLPARLPQKRSVSTGLVSSEFPREGS